MPNLPNGLIEIFQLEERPIQLPVPGTQSKTRAAADRVVQNRSRTSVYVQKHKFFKMQINLSANNPC